MAQHKYVLFLVWTRFCKINTALKYLKNANFFQAKIEVGKVDFYL